MQLTFETIAALAGIFSTVGGIVVALNRMFVASLIDRALTPHLAKLSSGLDAIRVDMASQFASLDRKFVMQEVHNVRYETLKGELDGIKEDIAELRDHFRRSNND